MTIILALLGFFVSFTACVYFFVWALCRIAAQSDAEIEYPAWLPEPKEGTK